MDGSGAVDGFRELQAAVQEICTEVAEPHAADVDSQARFPRETVDALRSAQVLGAAIPREMGGAGLNLAQLASLCATLAQGCGSSAMVLAMHYIQIACLARHGRGSPALMKFLGDAARNQYLLASITSEVGTFGDTRTSICALERNGTRFRLDKEATTGSYCAHADGILVTCRRSADAAASDQLLVLVLPQDYELKQTTSWDTLGMRGTCSPGFSLKSNGGIQQVVPGSFAESSAQTMVPFSHVLWSSLWWGIGAAAVARAAEFVRTVARKNPGTIPANADRLAEAVSRLQMLRLGWQGLAREFDEVDGRPGGREQLAGMGWALKFNNLKVGMSEAVPRLVHEALQIIGILAYKNDTKFSLGRHYRDALSGALMISNERIISKNASMLLVCKEPYHVG